MMVALIVEKTSSGRIRTCNSRCYNAKGAVCVCCCGGKNHGVGFDKAIENTRETAEKIANTAFQLPFKEVQA